MLNLRYWIANTLAVIAVIASVAAGPGWFVRGTLYDTDSFATRVDTAVATDGVQTAVADHVVTEIFQLAGLERLGSDDEEVDEEEPAEEATPTIATALESRANATTITVLESDRFRRTFDSAVRETHQQFLTQVEVDPDDELIQIDLDPVIDSVVDQLGNDPTTAFLGEVEVPEGSGVFTVAHEGQGGDFFWLLMRKFDDWATGALLVALVFGAAAIALSPERDRLLVSMGLGFGFVAAAAAALVWVARPLAGSVFINDSIGRDAFDDVYRVVASPFIRQELVVMALSALMVLAGFVLGVIERRRYPVDEWLDYDGVYPNGQAMPPGQPFPPGQQFPSNQPVRHGQHW